MKVRKGASDILEKGFLSVEKNTQDEAAPNIFVYRSAAMGFFILHILFAFVTKPIFCCFFILKFRDQIKKVIFTYNIIRKISKIEKINNSAKNLKATFYRKGDTGSLVTDIIKAQVVI